MGRLSTTECNYLPTWCLRHCLHVGVVFLCVHLRSPFCLYMTGLGALVVRHGAAAGTQRQSASCYQKVL